MTLNLSKKISKLFYRKFQELFSKEEILFSLKKKNEEGQKNSTA